MQNTNKQKRNLDEVFLLKGEINMHERNAKTQKRTQENFIKRWSATKSPMLECIDLGVK